MTIRVAETWAELGFKIKPMSYWVFVRTDPVERRRGLIWLPDKVADFWGGGLGHQRIVTAVVCAVGPTVSPNHGFVVGDQVAFKRLHFVHYRKMEDGTYFGWINANEVVGFPEPEQQVEEAKTPELLNPEYAL